MSHHPAFRYADDVILPACSCGRWTGKATRWTSQANAQFNIHAQAVGAPTMQIATPRETWARRYLGARGGVA
jgi:hypothetical protein